MRSRRALTLVEILVVLGVVVILMAVLLPSIGRAKRAAKTAQCLENLRQLAIATIAYGGDSGDCMPYPVGTRNGQPDENALWFTALDRYLSKTRYGDLARTSTAAKRAYVPWKECSVWGSFSGDSTKPRVNSTLTIKEYSRTLKMNAHLRRVGGDFARFTDIDQPLDHVLFGDGTAVDLIDWNENTSETGQFSMDVNDGGVGGIGLRHDGAANIVFVDGHASTEKLPTVQRKVGSSAVMIPSWQSEFVDAGGSPVLGGINPAKTMAEQGLRRNPAMPLIWSKPGRLYRP